MGFHFEKQLDAMDCGIACLAMVCRHFGARYSKDYLASLCKASAEGVSMLAISRTAERLGLAVTAARVSPEDLSSAPLPCVLHWNQNHFVVLYKITRGGKYCIADPAKGLLKLSEDEMAEHWAYDRRDEKDRGIAMFFETTPEFRQGVDESAEKRRGFRFLFRYLVQYRRFLTQIILGLALGCVLQLILPFLTQWVVDIGIRHRDIGFIWLVLLGELMIVVGRTLADFIRRWLLLHISMRINISLVSDFFIKLLRLPMSFFDTRLTGDLLQRMGDHSRVQTFLTGQLLGMTFSILTFVVFGVVLFIYNPLVFGVFILGSVIYGAWISMFLRRRKVIDYELFEQQARSQNSTLQFITAMQEIKLQDCRRRRRWEWEDTQAALFNVQMKAMKLQQTQEAGSIFINEIKNIIITVLTATAVIHGELSLGAMLAVQYIIGQLNSPVEQLMSFIYSVQDVKISLERINQVHEGKEEDEGRIPVSGDAGAEDIVLSHVDFKYDPHALDFTLRDVDFRIPKGKVTAIVGASGSGKTTIIKLLLGYYPLLAGKITVGRRVLTEICLDDWRRRCGVVMQDGVIFSESIERNIAVDDGEVSPERLHAAAEMANVSEYVAKLPMKYKTKVGKDGIGLSQGQKQRILIARAIYRNPDFIFLDEATNSLDAENERLITERLDRFYRGKTVVVVAHRLSTVRNADNIIVLDHGTIAETGTHEELTAAKGIYYNLVKNQLELGS